MLHSLKDKYDFEVEHIGFELHEGTPESGEDMNRNHPGTPQTIGISAQEVKNALKDSRYVESLQKIWKLDGVMD